MPVTDLPVSSDLGSYKRSELVDRKGISYTEFRKLLTPRFGKVWLDIAAGYAGLVLCGIGSVFLARWVPAWLTILPAALLFGYFVAYIQLFFHEAAHFNIASGRRFNDILANIFIGLLVGLEIKSYRYIHFGHHRHLGKPIDPERTYFDPLNVRFVVEALLGVKTLQVMRLRKTFLQGGDSSELFKNSIAKLQLILGLLLNGAVLFGLYKAQLTYLAIAWVFGIGAFVPFFGAVRQVLEHRSEKADENTDYTVLPHGEVTRMFLPGPIGSTLGGAGFDRHLLHHWDPQVSYTRLADLERFLLETRAMSAVATKQTYITTFWQLFRK